MACQLGAVSEYLAGMVDDPIGRFSRVEFETRGLESIHAVAEAHLALLHMKQGSRQAGLRHADRAASEIRDLDLSDYPMVALVHCVESYADAIRGAMACSVAAHEHGLAQIEVMQESVPRAGIHFRLILSDAACARGDHTLASDLVAAAEELLPLEPDALVLADWVDRLRDRLLSVATSGNGPTTKLTDAEMRVLSELPSCQSLEQIGERLYISRNTVKSHTVSIYRKLNVSNRSAAVGRARDIGLLAD